MLIPITCAATSTRKRRRCCQRIPCRRRPPKAEELHTWPAPTARLQNPACAGCSKYAANANSQFKCNGHDNQLVSEFRRKEPTPHFHPRRAIMVKQNSRRYLILRKYMYIVARNLHVLRTTYYLRLTTFSFLLTTYNLPLTTY